VLLWTWSSGIILRRLISLASCRLGNRLVALNLVGHVLIYRGLEN